MSAVPEKTKYQKWIDRFDENAKPTPKGVRVALTVYVYPDDHGNLMFQRPETGKSDEANQPVANIEQAVEAFRAVWERAASHPK